MRNDESRGFRFYTLIPIQHRHSAQANLFAQMRNPGYGCVLWTHKLLLIEGTSTNNEIISSLQHSGIRVIDITGGVLRVEDPLCVLRGFENFAYYAWIGIAVITGLLLLGWGFALLRGSKFNYFENFKNLILIMVMLSALRPLMNVVFGDDLFARGCNYIDVKMSDIQNLLEMRNREFTTGSGVPRSVDISVVKSASSATESGNDVIYGDMRRVGGSRAWRNNNPGNIRYGDFARRNGAIGSAGGFAIFPDEQTGMNAIGALLKTSNYQNQTIAGAISRYAPPFENDTNAYHARIEKLTGLSRNTPMSSLSDDELSRVSNAIRQIEGWKPGREVSL